MSKVYKWILRTALGLAIGASLFACGCPSPCGLKIPCIAGGCPFSWKNLAIPILVGQVLET